MAGSMELPASALSPVPLPPGVHPQFQFGNHFGNHGPRRRFVTHRDHGNIFVPVPVFYPIYGYGDPAYPVADPYIPAITGSGGGFLHQRRRTDDPRQLPATMNFRQLICKAREMPWPMNATVLAMATTIWTLASACAATKKRTSAPPAAVEPAPQPARENNSPKTVFIFKDGHQIETRNFAIVGQTLYDFSDSGLKKVQLSEMDKDATVKANDDRGIQVKLP